MSPILRILAALLLVLALPAAAVDEVFQTEQGAIRGYDPVAYHVENRPVKGRAEFSHRWNGANWRFASAANRALFAADPARYAPQYGGYCAFGTSRGYKVSTDPDAFAIVDCKLYLNYSKPVQTTWNRDRPGYIATADRNWVELAPTPYVEQ
jgi:YHS domain-containing protein